jgi:hypothetical protein
LTKGVKGISCAAFKWTVPAAVAARMAVYNRLIFSV